MNELTEEYIFQPHYYGVGDLAFSDDDSYLATSGIMNEAPDIIKMGVRVWRTSDWQLVGEYECGSNIERIEGLIYCSDGSILLGEGTEDEDFVVRISPKDWKSEIVVRNILCIRGLVPGHNKNQFVIHTPSHDPEIIWKGDSVSYYEIETWRLEKTIELGLAEVSAVAFSPVGTECAKAIHGKVYGPDRSEMAALELYSNDFSNKITDLCNDAFIGSMSYSSNGSYLATMQSLDILRVWEVESQKELLRISLYDDRYPDILTSSNPVVFSNDGTRIACHCHPESLAIFRSPFH